MHEKNKQIGIVVALPEERVALANRMRQVKRRLVDGIPLFEGMLESRPVCVAEGGMGTVAASRATRLLLSEVRPCLLISAGFCGAVHEGARVADLVVCKRLFTSDSQGLQEVTLPGSELSCARLSAELQSKGLRTWQGCFITTQQVLSKAAFAQQLPVGLPTPVLEMESSVVALAAAKAGIPFLGMRAISDDAAEELSFTLDELTDAQLRISILRVLLTCLKKPRIIPQLGRLAANSGRAGKALGAALQQIITKL